MSCKKIFLTTLTTLIFQLSCTHVLSVGVGPKVGVVQSSEGEAIDSAGNLNFDIGAGGQFAHIPLEVGMQMGYSLYENYSDELKFSSDSFGLSMKYHHAIGQNQFYVRAFTGQDLNRTIPEDSVPGLVVYETYNRFSIGGYWWRTNHGPIVLTPPSGAVGSSIEVFLESASVEPSSFDPFSVYSIGVSVTFEYRGNLQRSTGF